MILSPINILIFVLILIFNNLKVVD